MPATIISCWTRWVNFVRGQLVVVVEHDEDTMARADFIVDLGPGAGVEGGEVVAGGT